MLSLFGTEFYEFPEIPVGSGTTFLLWNTEKCQYFFVNNFLRSATEGPEGANRHFLALKIWDHFLVRRCTRRAAISQGMTSQTEGNEENEDSSNSRRNLDVVSVPLARERLLVGNSPVCEPSFSSLPSVRA
jgi:hypothetical protein